MKFSAHLQLDIFLEDPSLCHHDQRLSQAVSVAAAKVCVLVLSSPSVSGDSWSRPPAVSLNTTGGRHQCSAVGSKIIVICHFAVAVCMCNCVSLELHQIHSNINNSICILDRAIIILSYFIFYALRICIDQHLFMHISLFKQNLFVSFILK